MTVTGLFSLEVVTGIRLACRKFRMTVPESLHVTVRLRTKRLTKVRGQWCFPNKLAKPDGWAVCEMRRISATRYEIIAAADPKTGKVSAFGVNYLRRHEPARVVLRCNGIKSAQQDAMMKKAGLW